MDLNNKNRNCDKCEVCCTLVRVEEGNFYKPENTPCKFLKKDGHGCSIHNKGNQPHICKVFKCAWLYGMGDEESRPDKSGVFITINTFNGGTWIFVMETKENAHLTTGKNIIIDMAKRFNMPIIISDYNTKIGEDYGDYVVLKKELESKSNQIKGDFICELSNNINLYKLIISK